MVRSLYFTKMDCLNAKFLSNLVPTGHLFNGQSKNLPQKGFWAIEKKSGRPRKTTARDDIAMKRIVVRSPTSSCKKVRANLLRKDTDVSISTVYRRLSKEFGLKSCKPAKKNKNKVDTHNEEEASVCQKAPSLDCR